MSKCDDEVWELGGHPPGAWYFNMTEKHFDLAIQAARKDERKKVVNTLRNSPFLTVDVNKEDVLLIIEHGDDWLKHKPANDARVAKDAATYESWLNTPSFGSDQPDAGEFPCDTSTDIATTGGAKESS